MSKRSTTGLPKPSQPKPEPASKGRLQPRLLREYRSKAEREAEIQRLVILGTAVAAGIAVLILLGAFINQQFIVPGQAVATVNGQSITVSQFKKRATLERALLIEQLNSAISLFQSFGATSDQIVQEITSQAPYSTWYNELQISDQLGNSVLNTMVEDELVRQKAASLNISVSDADIDGQIQKFFGVTPPPANGAAPTATPTATLTPTPIVSPTPSLTPTPSATPTATAVSPTPAQSPTPTNTPFPTATASSTPNATEQATQFGNQRDDFFATIRSETGLTDADIRDYFRVQALREKVRDAVITDVARSAPFVNARHILLDNQDDANTVVQALQSGESFSDLAKQMSKDNSASSGGELGWAPVSNYVKEFADAVSSAEIGAIVGPVKSQFGYHVIQVRAREDREMTDTQYDQTLNTKFADYLKTLRSDPSTNVQIYDTWTNNVPTEPVFSPNI